MDPSSSVVSSDELSFGLDLRRLGETRLARTR